MGKLTTVAETAKQHGQCNKESDCGKSLGEDTDQCPKGNNKKVSGLTENNKSSWKFNNKTKWNATWKVKITTKWKNNNNKNNKD